MAWQVGWRGVELRHLVALQAVAEERSFSAAAAKLGYTQSAISGQILALERAIGARLVERMRGSRPVRLTPEGEIMLAHAAAITGRLNSAQGEIASLGGAPRARRPAAPRCPPNLPRRCPDRSPPKLPPASTPKTRTPSSSCTRATTPTT